MGITVTSVSTATAELAAALNGLLPQLVEQAPRLEISALARIIAQPGVALLVAHDDAEPVEAALGTALVSVVEDLTGRHARLEDVVVDERARGRGIGAALTAEAIRVASDEGAVSLNLTSAPHREAANRLYQRMGFSRYETNVYHLSLNRAQ
jgi:ribosomal protein S18 acetylase RimI-like enzyme